MNFDPLIKNFDPSTRFNAPRYLPRQPRPSGCRSVATQCRPKDIPGFQCLKLMETERIPGVSMGSKTEIPGFRTCKATMCNFSNKYEKTVDQGKIPTPENKRGVFTAQERAYLRIGLAVVRLSFRHFSNANLEKSSEFENVRKSMEIFKKALGIDSRLTIFDDPDQVAAAICGYQLLEFEDVKPEKTIGCPDVWISDVPIHQPSQKSTAPPKSSSSSSSWIPQSSSIPSSSRIDVDTDKQKKPFKSISAEIGFVQPLNLMDALRVETPAVSEALTGRGGATVAPIPSGLFDDWDPTTILQKPPATSPKPRNEIPSDPTNQGIENLKIPKEEILDETESEDPDESSDFASTSQLIRDLLNQQMSQSFSETSGESTSNLRIKRKIGEEDTSNLNYVITCGFPNCGLQYNWRVKYGKLRLMDHALTHSDRKIPCKLCGFESPNVRRMRSHYAKVHPTERVEGYGMKALVSGDFGGDTVPDEHSEEDVKELWNTCYSQFIDVVGQASGFSDGEKYKRNTKRRKMERESIN